MTRLRSSPTSVSGRSEGNRTLINTVLSRVRLPDCATLPCVTIWGKRWESNPHKGAVVFRKTRFLRQVTYPREIRHPASPASASVNPRRLLTCTIAFRFTDFTFFRRSSPLKLLFPSNCWCPQEDLNLQTLASPTRRFACYRHEGMVGGFGVEPSDPVFAVREQMRLSFSPRGGR